MVELYIEDESIVPEVMELADKRGMDPQMSDEGDHTTITIGNTSRDQIQLAVGMITKKFGRDKISVR